MSHILNMSIHNLEYFTHFLYQMCIILYVSVYYLELFFYKCMDF